jgi:hypothetical protein
MAPMTLSLRSKGPNEEHWPSTPTAGVVRARLPVSSHWSVTTWNKSTPATDRHGTKLWLIDENELNLT